MPLGMSSACWWVQRGGSSLGAVTGSRGVTLHLGVSLWMASCVVSSPRRPCPLPQGREDTRVPCNVRVPPPLPPLPRRGWVAHPEPAPPSPFPSPDCLSEYRKNKLCRWPPASQKHLMSLSAQAALQGCINLEEFPAWELLPGGFWLPPFQVVPSQRDDVLLAVPGGASCPTAAPLAPLQRCFPAPFFPPARALEQRGCSAGNLTHSCARGWGRAAGASGGLRGALPPTSDVER